LERGEPRFIGGSFTVITFGRSTRDGWCGSNFGKKGKEAKEVQAERMGHPPVHLNAERKKKKRSSYLVSRRGRLKTVAYQKFGEDVRGIYLHNQRGKEKSRGGGKEGNVEEGSMPFSLDKWRKKIRGESIPSYYCKE